MSNSIDIQLSPSFTTQQEIDIKIGNLGPKGSKGDKGEDGPQGPQGIAGKGFKIAKTYSSVNELLEDLNPTDIEVGEFAVIVTSTNLEDNGKLYLYTETGYQYMIDISGTDGVEGPQGPQGPQGIQGLQGEQGIQGLQGERGLAGLYNKFITNTYPAIPTSYSKLLTDAQLAGTSVLTSQEMKLGTIINYDIYMNVTAGSSANSIIVEFQSNYGTNFSSVTNHISNTIPVTASTTKLIILKYTIVVHSVGSSATFLTFASVYNEFNGTTSYKQNSSNASTLVDRKFIPSISVGSGNSGQVLHVDMSVRNL